MTSKLSYQILLDFVWYVLQVSCIYPKGLHQNLWRSLEQICFWRQMCIRDTSHNVVIWGIVLMLCQEHWLHQKGRLSRKRGHSSYMNLSMQNFTLNSHKQQMSKWPYANGHTLQANTVNVEGYSIYCVPQVQTNQLIHRPDGNANYRPQ